MVHQRDPSRIDGMATRDGIRTETLLKDILVGFLRRIRPWKEELGADAASIKGVDRRYGLRIRRNERKSSLDSKRKNGLCTEILYMVGRDFNGIRMLEAHATKFPRSLTYNT